MKSIVTIITTPTDAQSKDDDELGDKPYLAGFEWDKEESWTSLIVHQKKENTAQQSSKKSKKKKDEA